MNPRRDRWLTTALAFWALTPIAVLLLRALAPVWRFPDIAPAVDGIGVSFPPASAARVGAALATSLGLALTTGPVSAFAGFAIAKTIAGSRPVVRRAALAVALLAVVAPPVALAVGLQVALLSLGLGGTWAGVWLAHLVPAAGYLTLFAFGVFTSVDLTMEAEARTLGATPRQVWSRVWMPLLRPRLAEGAVLGGLVSWGQLALTLLVGGGVVRTLPVELLSFVQSGNDQFGALAALVLSVPPLAAIGLLKAGTARSGAVL